MISMTTQSEITSFEAVARKNIPRLIYGFKAKFVSNIILLRKEG